MKARILFLTVLALLLGVAGAAFAQDDLPLDLCFGLSAEDCAVINEASANGIGDAQSYTQELSIEFSLSNFPSEEGPVSVTFNSQSRFDTVLLDDGSALVQGTVDFSANDGMTDTEGSFEVRIVDNVLYLQDPQGSGAWIGLDLNETDALDAATDTTMDEAGELVDPTMVDTLVALTELPGLLSYTRDGDVFRFVLDITAMRLLLEPENEDLLLDLSDMASELNPAGGLLVMTLPTLFESGEITVTQTVNPERNIVETLEFGIDASANLAALLTGDANAGPTDVFLRVVTTSSNYDNVSLEGLTAPEDAQVFTLDELIGQLMGSMMPQQP